MAGGPAGSCAPAARHRPGPGRGPGAGARLVAGAALLLALGTGAPAFGGGGPERVLVVANADSPASLEVANAYVRLRGIPPEHVCRVTGIPTLRVVPVDWFRDHLLRQVLDFVRDHGLIEEIDTIAWSVDFPYGVDFRADFEDVAQDARVPRIAALTGLTYLWRRVVEKDRNYEALQVNKYFRPLGEGSRGGHGFEPAWRWALGDAPDREPHDATLDRYHLSTLLGYTGEQGNTLPEVHECLRRATQSDGTQPDGAVYLMKNGDVRARTREPTFARVVERMLELGGRAEILEADKDGQDGKVPRGRADAIGIVAGIASFEWPKDSAMLPGAIAEHLTSFGAMFNGSGQTKLSAFLRAGAAGSSGTVAEPLAIPNKFPSAALHVWYREGCSLAESFYQSVYGPYQLLIVGDPLARPYARFARVGLAAPALDAPLRGEVDLEPAVEPAPDRPVGRTELFVDGQRVATAPPGAPLRLDTRPLDDGWHRLRIVAVEDTPVATRSGTDAAFEVRNGAGAVTLQGPRGAVELGESLELKGKVEGGGKATVRVFRGVHLLGEVEARGVFRLKVPAAALGPGVAEVYARAVFAEGPAARSLPVEVTVEPPAVDARHSARRPGGRKRDAEAPGAAGLRARLTLADGKEREGVVPTLGLKGGDDRFAQHLKKIAPGPYRRVELEGFVRAPAPGAYQFVINATGRLTLAVGGVDLLEGAALEADRQAYAMVRLPEGWHPLRLVFEPAAPAADLSVLLAGAQVAEVLAGAALRH